MASGVAVRMSGKCFATAGRRSAVEAGHTESTTNAVSAMRPMAAFVGAAASSADATAASPVAKAV